MMARSRSRSASRPYEPASRSAKAVSKQKAAALSPSRRRVTRSQSREPELSGQKGDVGTDQPSTNGQRWKQNIGRKGTGLDAVAEESPVRSPAKSPRKSGARLENHAMLDLPEDAANISGTTILPSEPDNDLDPEMMLESLPDLERTARDVLKLLVPASTDPVSIVNLASKLADPKNTQSRRLSRSKSKFESEASYFGSQSYINTEKISETIHAALQNKLDVLADDWTPDLIVQKANCARFAIEVLLARAGTGASRQAIQHVEGLFPSVFMSDIHDGQRLEVGQSSLGKDTFNLALEIRTQYLIGSMEEQQDDPGFDPDALLKLGFFVDEIDDEIYDSSEAPLRGFNLDNFGGTDGYLPSRYRDAAYDRFNEMRVLVADGLDELKSSFRWSRFALKAAQWLRKRNDEIDRQLNRQRQADDLKDEFFATPRSARRVSGIVPRSETTQSPSRRTSARPSSVTAEHQKRMVARGSPFAATPTKLRISSSIQEPESHTVPETQRPLFVVPPIPPETSDAPRGPDDAKASDTQESPTETAPAIPETPEQPVNQPEPATAPEIRDRRKSKSSFLNAASMDRLMQRQRRRSDFVPSSSQVEGDTLVPEGQDDIVPAASQPRTAEPVAPAAPTEPIQLLEPPPDSPLFVPQDDDFLSANDTGFTLDEDNSRIQIERSHSPPVRNRSRQESGRQRTDSLASIPVNRSPVLPTDQELWQATKKHAASTSDTRKDKHPRAAFIDHQENAHRVSPISHSANPPSSQKTRFAPPQSNKRRRAESDDEDEDEESESGFASDTRKVDISRKRAQKPTQPANKRQRTTNIDEDQASPEAQDPEPSTQPEASIPYRSSQPSSSFRPRMKWDSFEDKRLIRLIRDFATKWSTIEQENDAQPERTGEKRFEGRGQVQIKDRARNLKIGFIRDEIPLPKNFEHVTISKKDKERLARLGRNVENV